MCSSRGNRTSTIPIPKHVAGDPETCWITDLVGTYFQKCWRSRKICELAPPSTCIRDEAFFNVNDFDGTALSHSWMRYNFDGGIVAEVFGKNSVVDGSGLFLMEDVTIVVSFLLSVESFALGDISNWLAIATFGR